MDIIYTKYKQNFISAIQSTLDMFYNSIDSMDLKRIRGEQVDEAKYDETKEQTITLERILKDYKINNIIKPEDERYVVAALGTAIVHLEYLADSYREAAKFGKMIIANLKGKK